MPAHVLRVKETDLAWYRFYTFVVTLDDDLDDVLADAIAGRNTPDGSLFDESRGVLIQAKPEAFRSTTVFSLPS